MNNTTSHQGRLKSLRAAGIGNALEWFDWTLYATFSVYLASNLFDKTDARSAMLATLAVFAVGFCRTPYRRMVVWPTERPAGAPDHHGAHHAVACDQQPGHRADS